MNRRIAGPVRPRYNNDSIQPVGSSNNSVVSANHNKRSEMTKLQMLEERIAKIEALEAKFSSEHNYDEEEDEGTHSLTH